MITLANQAYPGAIRKRRVWATCVRSLVVVRLTSTELRARKVDVPGKKRRKKKTFESNRRRSKRCRCCSTRPWARGGWYYYFSSLPSRCDVDGRLCKTNVAVAFPLHTNLRHLSLQHISRQPVEHENQPAHVKLWWLCCCRRVIGLPTERERCILIFAR